MFGFTKKRQQSGSASLAPEYILAGLGNPGREYENTRHNTGFLFVELLCGKLNFTVKKLRFKSLTGDTVIAGHRVLVMLPQTFMNNSGEAVRECASFYKIPPERILVVYDDISLPVGTVRIRKSGSDGGHNGIKSIIYHLNSDAFPRIKLGVGAKPDPRYDLKDYVLSGFGKDDAEHMKAAMERAAEALPLIFEGNLELAMSKYNG